MSEEQFYERVNIAVIKSGAKYEASITIIGMVYTVQGSTAIEAKEGLWEYLVDEVGL